MSFNDLFVHLFVDVLTFYLHVHDDKSETTSMSWWDTLDMYTLILMIIQKPLNYEYEMCKTIMLNGYGKLLHCMQEKENGLRHLCIQRRKWKWHQPECRPSYPSSSLPIHFFIRNTINQDSKCLRHKIDFLYLKKYNNQNTQLTKVTIASWKIKKSLRHRGTRKINIY